MLVVIASETMVEFAESRSLELFPGSAGKRISGMAA